MSMPALGSSYPWSVKCCSINIQGNRRSSFTQHKRYGLGTLLTRANKSNGVVFRLKPKQEVPKNIEEKAKIVFGRTENMGAEEEKVQENEKSRPTQNPMSQAQFLSWKRQKDADASARIDEAARKRAEDIAAGAVQMNGRELFLHEPWVFDNTRY